MPRESRAGRRAMLGAGLVAAAVFASLTLVGLGAVALPAAAGVLVLACIAVGVVVVVTQSRALKEVDRAISRLVDERRDGIRNR